MVKILQVAAGPKDQVSCSFADKYNDLRANPHIPMQPTFRFSQWTGVVKTSHLSLKEQKNSSKKKRDHCVALLKSRHTRKHILVKRTTKNWGDQDGEVLTTTYKGKAMKPEVLCL